MITNKLMFNNSKTEMLLVGTPQQLQKITCHTSITVGESLFKPAEVVRDLRAWFDQNISMNTHVRKISASAFFYLYNIRHIRKFLSRENTETLIHTFITSRLDYCNSLLYVLPDSTLCKLQRIQNVPV